MRLKPPIPGVSMSIWRWAEWLDPVPEASRVTLGEGNTPLVRSRRIGPAAGLRELYLKLDYACPTGSYKDRFAAAAVSHMVAAGQSRCVATSSGNTGAALAAYCAAAGIECHVAIVEAAPEGKLQQMLAYGAKLYRVRGFGIDPDVSAGVLDAVRRLGARPDSATQISAYAFSPLGMSGVKTASYEIAERLGPRVGHVFCPAGGGGMAVAIARGFDDLVRAGELPRSPRVEVVQPEGNDTIATPLREGTPPRDVRCTTRVSGLQVPTVIDGALAIDAARASGGTGHVVADDEVWDAQARLAREEGIFCEPAAATALAGALKAAREGRIDPEAPTVCFVTGTGFKDPPAVARMLEGVTCPLIELDQFIQLS
jgi:threonine synthase